MSFDSGSDSSCAVHNEKLKIGNEIEILGERLRMVKLEKEKLAFLAEKGESEKGQLKLLEEMENHLQQIKQMRNPVRGASLPPLSSKVQLVIYCHLNFYQEKFSLWMHICGDC